MSGLIDSNPVKVESFQRQAGGVNQSVHDKRLPFWETILHGSEFGQLTVPIRMDTKGLHIAVLIEVRGPTTTFRLDLDCSAVILPERREDTGSVVIVAYL